MRVLLDSCTFIWLDSERHKIAPGAAALLQHPSTIPLLSIASIWEIAIKRSLGKVSLSTRLEDVLKAYVASGAVTLFPIEVRHALAVETLPHHHRDPFDRLIIAQALVEGIPVISADAKFDEYGVERIWE